MRRRRLQPRDAGGRYIRIRRPAPPWWFIVLVVALVWAAAYLL
jgi:hypothetical protein